MLPGPRGVGRGGKGDSGGVAGRRGSLTRSEAATSAADELESWELGSEEDSWSDEEDPWSE